MDIQTLIKMYPNIHLFLEDLGKELLKIDEQTGYEILELAFYKKPFSSDSCRVEL